METKVTGCDLAAILDIKAEVGGTGLVIRAGKVVYDTPPEAQDAEKDEEGEATCDLQADSA